MKTINKYIGIGLSAAMMWSCTYDAPEQVEPTSGSADFSKMVSVGNSLTAGYMNGALYTAGQENSFPALLAKQMAEVGGGTFNQPDINSVHGYYGEIGTTVLGRLRLVYPRDANGQPITTATPAPTPFVPGDEIVDYTGDEAALNNFGVPGVTVGHVLSPLAVANPLYKRFASNVGTSTIIGDAATALGNGGTFFTFWLGNNDVLGYATGGAADEAILTSDADFTVRYDAALDAMLTANESAKGAVANIPNVSDVPYFTAVPYNSIKFDPKNPVDVGTVALLNSNFAGFNGALDGIVAGLGHDANDAAMRKISYDVATANPVLIYDQHLENLGAKFDMLLAATLITADERAALQPFVQARPMTADDLVILPAATVLGTLANPADPTTVWGVAVPMSDQYILTSSEIVELDAIVKAFNATIKAKVDENSDRLVLVDVNTIFSNLVANGASVNGSGLDASFAPPFGAFSADGVHPNTRGYAYITNRFIETINAKFKSDIPLLNPNNYAGNELPE